ncbi:MAG: polyprenyl synthetase family protein [Candidatus Cryptobacteroides sp.]|nr:polyprenyl synthetase family protein [Candidatus Cryptobacteroides sp.]
MTLEEVRIFLGKDWEDTDALIRSSLESDIELLNATNAAILSHGGKQLRPLISLLVARACSGGVANADSIHYAAASELLHNATLLHDDVADSSSERRGCPTVMSLLGGAASVLIGDYWLVRAMENILASSAHGNEVIRIFSRTLSHLAEGEMLQLQKATSGDTDEKDYLRIIYSKTASLFESSAVSAAISVNATPEQVEAVRDYAVSLGIAFQIKDDIFDYSDGKDIGKPVGIDLEEQKITLPLLGALKSVSAEEEAAIRKKVTDIHEHPEYKEEIRNFVRDRKGVEYAVSVLKEYVAKANEALSVLPDSREKEYLTRIAGFTAYRNN